MSGDLKSKTLSALVWSFGERFALQIVQFSIGIILARLLSPSDFGLIGMLSLFLAVSQSIIDSGFTSALIRKADRSEIDYSTVFYFNILVGLLLYAMLFFSAHHIADFYNAPLLKPLTRITGLTLLINSISVVQRARLMVAVDFKTLAKASFISVLAGSIIATYMAFSGYGVWTLAVQSVVTSGAGTLCICFFSRWIPLREFSLQSFRELYAFGSKLLLSGIIDTIYNNAFTIVIGRKFSAQMLGYYSRADQFVQLPSSNVAGVLARVTFPLLSSVQHDDMRLRELYRKYLRISSFIIFPLMVFLAALSKPLIELLLSEEWLPVIPLMQALCFAMMLYPVHAINLNLLQIKGRSALFLRLEILKKIIGVCLLIITIPLGVFAMCVGRILSSAICLLVNTHYTGHLLNFGFISQVKDLYPHFLISLLSGICVWGWTFICSNSLLALVVGFIIGVSVYSFFHYIRKSQELFVICDLIRKSCLKLKLK